MYRLHPGPITEDRSMGLAPRYPAGHCTIPVVYPRVLNGDFGG